jgi:hypothetical protein
MASWPRLAWLPYTVKASVEAVPTRGIRSNCDYPRPIATPALATLLGGDGRPESYLDFFSTGSNDLTQIGDQTAWFSASSPPPYVESREVGAREVLQRRGTAAYRDPPAPLPGDVTLNTDYRRPPRVSTPGPKPGPVLV